MDGAHDNCRRHSAQTGSAVSAAKRTVTHGWRSRQREQVVTRASVNWRPKHLGQGGVTGSAEDLVDLELGAEVITAARFVDEGIDGCAPRETRRPRGERLGEPEAQVAAQITPGASGAGGWG